MNSQRYRGGDAWVEYRRFNNASKSSPHEESMYSRGHKRSRSTHCAYEQPLEKKPFLSQDSIPAPFPFGRQHSYNEADIHNPSLPNWRNHDYYQRQREMGLQQCQTAGFQAVPNTSCIQHGFIKKPEDCKKNYANIKKAWLASHIKSVLTHEDDDFRNIFYKKISKHFIKADIPLKEGGVKKEKVCCEKKSKQSTDKGSRIKEYVQKDIVTTRECTPINPDRKDIVKEEMIRRKDDNYSLLFYSICVEEGKVFTVNRYGISQNPIRRNEKVDENATFEKFCVPSLVRKMQKAKLSDKIKYVVNNIENLFPNLEEDRPDPNFKYNFALTHAIFIPSNYYEMMIEENRLSASACLPFCSAVMRGKVKYCFTFDLEADLNFLREINEVI